MDGNWFGYINQVTYTAVEAEPDVPQEPEVPEVNVGDVFKFTALAGENNGDNGLTMYYTSDGATITPFELYDAGQGRWYEVTNDAVSFFDPAENPTDNYGLGQASSSNYVVLGYKAPATGAIDLFSWTADQAGNGGFKVSIAQGTLDNVIQTYDAVTQGSPVYNTYSLNVTKGEELFFIYQPVNAVDGNWFGYINQVTYTAVEAEPDVPQEPEVPEVNVGDVFKFTALAGENNGDNGLTMYYTSDGATITPFELYDAGQGRWYEVTNDAVSFFDPAENPTDNYGLGQASSSNYVVLGYKAPATGAIDLFSWTADQAGNGGFKVSIAQGTLDNVIQTYDAVTQGSPVYNTYSLNVTKGEELFFIYQPVNAVDGNWFGYINQVTYTALGAAEPEEPEDPEIPEEPEVPDEPETPSDSAVQVGDVFKFTALAGENNGDNGMTMYYTSDGVTITPFELYDAGQGRWYEVTNDAVSFFDPAENPTDNYGLGQASSSNYVVLGYKAPATGAIDLFSWTADQAGNGGFKVSIAQGTLDNVIQTYDAVTQGSPVYNTYSLNVTKGEVIYFIYRPVNAVDGNWFGYINQITYTKVG